MTWKTNASRIVYDNAWIRVLEDDVTNPGGGSNQYAHVRFKNIAVAVLPIDEKGHTRLVGQSRYTLGEYSWELPMGGSPVDEDPLEGARRELAEETGLVAAEWIELMRLHTTNSITDELAIAYIARELTCGQSSPEETEDISVRSLPVGDAVQMALDGEITDAVSVATLLRYAFENQIRVTI